MPERAAGGRAGRRDRGIRQGGRWPGPRGDQRGGRVVAVSTVADAVADPAGLDVGRLLELAPRARRRVRRFSRPPVGPPGRAIHAVDADVVSPGPGPRDHPPGRRSRFRPRRRRSSRLPPMSPTPRRAPEVLHRRGILALPDFVCNAGAVIGYRQAWRPRRSSPQRCRRQDRRLIAERWPPGRTARRGLRACRPGSCAAGGATRPARRSRLPADQIPGLSRFPGSRASRTLSCRVPR